MIRDLRTAALAGLLLCAACAKDSDKPQGQSEADSTDSKKLLAAVDSLSGALKDRPKPFEVLTALGNLYYENGRYLDAVDSFRQALEKSAPLVAQTEALHARQIQPAAELPADCRRAPPAIGLEQIAAAARKWEAIDPAKALRCDEEAIGQVNDADARRADALYLIGQPDAALAEHKRVLSRAPDSPESLFFVGAITLEQSNGDKAKLEEGKKYWRKLLAVAPDHPRAALVKQSLPKADELFAAKPQQQLPQVQAQPQQAQAPMDQPAMPPGASPMAHDGPTPEAVKNIADAVAQTERTPELESGLDALLAQAENDLDNGRYQPARDKLVRVMPMRPSDPRTAADLGAAMAGLGKAEMAERVLSRALAGDPKQPRALYEMAKLLAARGDKAGARQGLQAVKQSDAKFASAHHVDEALQQLR